MSLGDVGVVNIPDVLANSVPFGLDKIALHDAYVPHDVNILEEQVSLTTILSNKTSLEATPLVIQPVVSNCYEEMPRVLPERSVALELPVRLVCWNIAGVVKNLRDPEWALFIESFDLCLLQETWAVETPHRVGYKTYGIGAIPSKSGRPSGGLLLWVKISLRAKVEKIDTNSVDLLALKIVLGNGKNLFLVNVYNRPLPSSRESPTIIKLDCFLSGLDPREDFVILAGDLNCNFEPVLGLSEIFEEEDQANKIPTLENVKSVKCSTQGLQMINLCTDHSLRACNGQLPSDSSKKPTFTRNNYKNNLDFVIASIPLWTHLLDLEVMERFESDHFPLILTLDVSLFSDTVQQFPFEENSADNLEIHISNNRRSLKWQFILDNSDILSEIYSLLAGIFGPYLAAKPEDESRMSFMLLHQKFFADPRLLVTKIPKKSQQKTQNLSHGKP
ncbi:uncharacterized protein LOC144783087 [Lissotriton helveticus]